MKLIFTLIIGTIFSLIVYAEDSSLEEFPPEGLVEKEYLAIRRSADPREVVAPYRERRQRWGFMFSAGYSLYSPENYQPNFQPDFDFEGLYDSNGMIEVNFTSKLNLSAISLGLGVGAGYFKASSGANAPAESQLTIFPVRAELSLILDGIMAEPWVAPYGLVGVYTNIFTEEQSAEAGTEAGTSFNGTTALGTYIGAGANFQLDWIEPGTALRSYLDYGIENTYLFVELKKYLTSTAEEDPDFETGMVIAAGAKFEY